VKPNLKIGLRLILESCRAKFVRHRPQEVYLTSFLHAVDPTKDKKLVRTRTKQNTDCHVGAGRNGLLALYVAFSHSLLALAALLAANSAFAVTWSSSPVSGDWNTGANWVGGVAPMGLSSIASFGSSNITNISISPDGNFQSISLASLVFNAGASAFTMTVNPSTFGFGLDFDGNGAGITNNSGIAQNFVCNGLIQFDIGATAGINTVFTVNSGGVMEFSPSSSSATAGKATIIINDGGRALFYNSATGGTARVEVFGSGNLDISPLSASGMTVGSVEGTGNVFLGARKLTVGGNNLNTSFSGVIQDGGVYGGTGGSLTKTGTGTLTLLSANTYTGATTISTGILNIQNAAALGSTTGGTTVSSGATLQIQGGITVGDEALFISGGGAPFATGTLENVSGTNNYGGLLTLGSTIVISSDSDLGTLNLTNTGTITGAGSTIDLVGAGNGSIASIIGTTTGGLAMNSFGTWILSGANTYTGGTSINIGILQLSGAGTLGATNGALTVNIGGTLDLNATSQSVGNLTGTGGTIVNNGGGAVTLTIGNGNVGGGNYARGDC
jgi:autotransporter-associated beta strand protein